MASVRRERTRSSSIGATPPPTTAMMQKLEDSTDKATGDTEGSASKSEHLADEQTAVVAR